MVWFAVAAAAYSIYEGIKSSDAQRKAARSQAAVDRAMAEQTLVRGKAEASRTYAEAADQAQAARAGLAAGNIDVNSGVGALLQEQTLESGKLNAEQVQKNAVANATIISQGGQNAYDASMARASATLTGSVINGGLKLGAAAYGWYSEPVNKSGK